jgi:hypothetical protein
LQDLRFAVFITEVAPSRFRSRLLRRIRRRFRRKKINAEGGTLARAVCTAMLAP